MDISYRTKKLRKVCTDYGVAQREYGLEMAEKIHLRIDDLRAADSIEMLVQYSIGRCHPLTGDRKGQYAMVLVEPFRLVFEKDNTNYCVQIVSIEDYH